MNFNNVRIVLVGPLYGGNVGAVCRAMCNMGLSDLAVVTPDKNLDMDEAKKMACHSDHILENMTIHDDLLSAIKDCTVAVGTSARRGLYRQHAVTPREIAPKIITESNKSRIAVVFGREDNGLTNDELTMCTDILNIPTATQNTSLNLSQAVLICCYELFTATETFEPQEEKSDIATMQMREFMFELWRNALLKIGFMHEDKANHMMYGLRRILSRGQLTQDDVKILMGIARQAEWASGEYQNKYETNKP
jgi:tRNA/rRNA methyltransferase